MKKHKFSIRYFGRKPVLVILVSVLLLTTVLSAVAQPQQGADKEKIVRQVAQKWVQIGTEQYNRGLFRFAEQSFLRAQDYQEYLTAEQRRQLNELLEKTHAAVVAEQEKENALDQQAKLSEPAEEQGTEEAAETAVEDRLIDANDKAAAKAESEAVQEQQTEPTDLVYPESKSFYDEEKAVYVEPPKPKPVEQPTEQGRGYIDVINRKRNIIRSHTRAVVGDAVAKTRGHIARGEFDKAKKAVETAQRIVNKNQLHLGDELFRRYSSELVELAGRIAQTKQERAELLKQQKQLEAIDAQRRIREQMTTDRARRIADLMSNAKAYMRQQRYEEALGQLESLLAIDPLNEEALIDKQTLSDTVAFRKQLEVVRESDKERVGLLLKADEAKIPYAEEFNYPKNWRQIIASPFRKPEEAIGRDLANEAVYKQLDEIVDLSDLTPLMSFSEAIDLIRNSVAPPLKIVVLWRDLRENADIDQDTPINMSGLPAVPLGTALKLLLRSISGEYAEIDYVVADGIITIATTGSLPSELIIRIYDVAQLLGAPAEFSFEMDLGEDQGGGGRSGGGGGGGGRSGGGGGRSGGGGGGGGSSRGGEEDAEELLGTEAVEERAEEIIELIQNSVDPDSWYEEVGGPSISIFAESKLVVRQTLENHKRIEQLISGLRKSLGQQVAIEARFLMVTENFLEDIGLDIDFTFNKLGGKWQRLQFEQDSSETVRPGSSGVPGSLTGLISDAVAISGGYGSILDDLEVNFLLRATQAHRNAKSLTAPKVTVLSGESAAIRVETEKAYVSDYDFEDITAAGEAQPVRIVADPLIDTIIDGVVLNVTPYIGVDKKYVLLRITTSFAQSVFKPFSIPSGIGEGEFPIDLPEQEIADIRTRVSVPDGGTLLIGGQKISGEVDIEEGVPVLSKIPLIGRLFDNRSTIRDDNILLILVKPTIILQEETEAQAVAAMESEF